MLPLFDVLQCELPQTYVLEQLEAIIVEDVSRLVFRFSALLNHAAIGCEGNIYRVPVLLAV